MVVQGGVWDLPLLGGRFHRERVSVTVGKYSNGPHLCNCIQIIIIIPYGALTFKHLQDIFGQSSLRPKGHQDVEPSVREPRVLHTKDPARQPSTRLWHIPMVSPGN